MGATWVTVHSQREECGEGVYPFPLIRTVAGKADENGQSFAQGSRNSCGTRPSVPALAHESEPNQWCWEGGCEYDNTRDRYRLGRRPVVLTTRKGGSMYSQATVKCEGSIKRCLTEKATLKRWAW